MSAAADIRAVMWDFGGVMTTSPFDLFAAYEADNGLPAGFIRLVNSTNPDTNAWARMERNEISPDEFLSLFEAEAAALGCEIDARGVLACLGGQLRPEMVRAVERCHARLKTALLTNNFIPPRGDAPEGPTLYDEVLPHFDVVIESSKVGYRKPDVRFYEMACTELAVEPSEAVFLDDLGVNLKPARDMGMRTIKVVDPADALRELEAVVGFALDG